MKTRIGYVTNKLTVFGLFGIFVWCVGIYCSFTEVPEIEVYAIYILGLLFFIYDVLRKISLLTETTLYVLRKEK